VQSVVEDEGFWVGSSALDRVYVEYGGDVGADETQGFAPEVGDTVDLTGELRPAPADPGKTLKRAAAVSGSGLPGRKRAAAPAGRRARSGIKREVVMRRLLSLSMCVAGGFALASIGGAFAGDAPHDRAAASSLRGLVDLSHPFNERTIYWPTAKRFKLTQVAEGETEGGYFYAANDFEAAEHGGTHLDAPVHFARGGDKADEIPLRRLVGRAVVVDVSERALEDRDYLVSRADLRRWERANGRIPRRAIVLLRTGYDRYWPDAERYLGTAERGEQAVAKLHFPGLSAAGARWLTNQRSVKAVGIDTASIDYGQSKDFLAHRILGAADVPVFENVARLGRLPSRGFMIVALPMKIDGGSGGPLRIVAVRGP